MKTILLLLSAIAAAASLSSCTESAASVAQPERPPENGAQFKEGEGLSLTDTMKKSIGLQTAEVTDEEIAPSFAVALHVMQNGEEASGSLTAEQAVRVQPGMEIEMREDSPDATVMKGIVTRIEKSPYAALGDFTLSVNGKTPLAAGSRLQATFRFPAGDAVTAVPRAALLTTAEGNFVYTKNGEFFMRTPVKTGAVSDGHVEITDGLYSGDEIVTTPVMSLWLAELQVLRGGKPCTCGS